MLWNLYQLMLFWGNKTQIGNSGSLGVKELQDGFRKIGNIENIKNTGKMRKLKGIYKNEYLESRLNCENNGYQESGDKWIIWKIGKCMVNITTENCELGRLRNMRKDGKLLDFSILFKTRKLTHLCTICVCLFLQTSYIW